MTHNRSKPWTDPRDGVIGKDPSGTRVGLRVAGQYTNQVNYHFGHPIFTFSGPADATYNEDTGFFYVILSGPEKEDTSEPDRRLCIAFMNWPNFDSSNDSKIRWQAPDDGSPTDIHVNAATSSSETWDYSDTEFGEFMVKTTDVNGDNIVWTPDGTNEFRLGKIVNSYYLVAALTVFEIPDNPLTDDQKHLLPTSFAPGRVIDSTNLSEAIEKVGDGDDHVESVERITRRTWQWGHPSGIWVEETSYTNVFGSLTIKMRGRELTSATTCKVRPAFVITADGQGDTVTHYIKVTNVTKTQSWTWSSTADFTTEIIDYTDGSPATGIDLDCDVTDVFEIEGYTSNATYPLIIHTAALFEGPAW
jgi:hypothetical protein